MRQRRRAVQTKEGRREETEGVGEAASPARAGGRRRPHSSRSSAAGTERGSCVWGDAKIPLSAARGRGRGHKMAAAGGGGSSAHGSRRAAEGRPGRRRRRQQRAGEGADPASPLSRQYKRLGESPEPALAKMAAEKERKWQSRPGLHILPRQWWALLFGLKKTNETPSALRPLDWWSLRMRNDVANGPQDPWKAHLDWSPRDSHF